MILNGNSRGHGQELARHLLNVEDNEHAVVHELRGFLADDLSGAFKETEAISLGTKCVQYLFSLSLNPPTSASASVDEFEKVIQTIEQRLGLTDQPRAIVFHEKLGRRHAHCVWSRINVEKMRGINLPHFKNKLTDISREIYLEKGWKMPAGLRNRDERDLLSFSHAEAGQAKRAKRHPKELKALFQSCWTSSDSASAFAAALWDQGLCLARGDRRSFVAVDAAGEVYSLSRWCGIKTKELRARIGKGEGLPDVNEARRLAKARLQQPEPSPSVQRQIEDHQARVSGLVQRHRQERQALRQSLEARRTAALKTAQAQLPKGLRAAWARLTGQHDRIVDRLAQEARQREAHDRAELQTLIDRQLAERRTIDVELEVLRAQHALEAEALDQDRRTRRRTYDLDPRQPLVLPRDDVPFTPNELKRKPELILEHISDKKARFTRNDVVRALSEFIDDPLDLRVAVDTAMRSPELVKVAGSEDAEYSTRDFQKVEASLSYRTKEMARSGGFRVTPSAIRSAIRNENKNLKRKVGATLSEEQINAIEHVLAPNQLSAVVGLAGTGKSTLLSVSREVWERQGYRVYGAALAGKAADSLESASGIKSRTLASLEASWKNGYEPIGSRDILVIDEVGMVGTRQLARIADRIQKLGCKLVLVGDPDQLQPIQAGQPFRDIVETTSAARLTEIRRQKEDWQRQASRDLAAGFVEAALREYADHGAVQEHEDRNQAIAALVEDYMADWQAHGDGTSRLALAHRRKDVHAINQAIRSAKDEFEGPRDELLVQTDHGPRAFSKGDRTMFTRNDRDLGVRNGMLGTIEKVDNEKLTVRLDADDHSLERQLTVSPRDFPAIDHGFAVTIHRAQGCTVDRSYVLSSQTLNRNLTYVALTRHRNELGFYTGLDNDMNRAQRNSPVSNVTTKPRRDELSRSR